MIAAFAAVTFSIFMICFSVQAADISRQEQLEEARQADVLRQERLQKMQVRPDNGYEEEEAVNKGDLPPVTPVFWVENIEIESLHPNFQWLRKIAQPFVNQQIGLHEINKVVHAMNQALIRRGYVTSRVTIPEQNLSSKKLRLVFEPGYFHTVIPAPG